VSTSPHAPPGDRPEPPTGELSLRAPPEVERNDGSGGVWMSAVAMLGGLGSVALVATSGQSPSGQARSLLPAGFFLLTTVAVVALQAERQWARRARTRTATRMQYLRYLATVRTIVRDAAARQRAALLWLHPHPSSLPALAGERTRVWEYGAADPQFLRVRYGVRDQPLSLVLVPPEPDPTRRVDPAAASALNRLLAVHRVQRKLPTSLDLRALDRIELCGAGEATRSLARAMICSAAAFHSPDDLAIAVLASEDVLAEWDWVKWLPHVLSPRARDAVGPRRMVSSDLTDLAALLPSETNERFRLRTGQPEPGAHLLLVVDGDRLPSETDVRLRDELYHVMVLGLPSRWGELDDGSCVRLLLEDGSATTDGALSVSAVRLHAAPVRAAADQCDLSTAEALARRLCPVRVVPTDATAERARLHGTGRPSDLMDLLGLGDVRRYDPASVWRQPKSRDHLRVPIGTGADGEPVHLDLKESARHGMGPHGLVIGATGSGKSELLRTLVLGLALTHSPEQLSMVLVDFKGGATFAGMSTMPHVSALITNLAEELPLVDRMQDALSGELVRRQRLLREAGQASLHHYERAREAGHDLPPLPSLFIVVDEFAEMLSAKPELLDLFVAVGRVGRSLGLHLLLAYQRLEEGRLRGLESHLSYRVVLRTFSAQDSRAALGLPDASELPREPGAGLLRADASALVRFTGAYVSGPPLGGSRPVEDRETDHGRGVLPWTITEVRLPEAPRPPEPPEPPEPPGPARGSLLDVAVSRMRGVGPAARQIWLPPLEVPDTLGELMPDLREDPELGLSSRRWRALAASPSHSGASTDPASSDATSSLPTCPAQVVTSPSSAAHGRARARCCAPSWPPCRS
jgi:S-DNA-T family DNA segregation ATPase FtsK/SpoIIIE